MRLRFLAGSLVLTLSVGLGCASTPTQAPSAPAPTVSPASTLSFFDGASGLPLTWDGIVATAAAADAVLIGEMHGHPQGLSAAADLFDAILARRPHTTALALEFMERDEQAHLDDYLAGITDTAGFEKAIGATESSYPPGHRRMVEAARAAQRPVIAANAPRRYVRLAREGFDRLRQLTPEQQRLIAIPDSVTEGPYKDRFFELMGAMGASHGETPDAPPPDEETILRIYRPQNVWDATMADAVAKALDLGNAPVVLVVGQFHIESQGGLTERLRGMRPGARIVTITMSEAEGQSFRAEDRGKADIIVNVGPASDSGIR